MPKKRPHRYDADFKRRAVEQVLHRRQPVAQVARELHCSPQSINNWIEKHRPIPGDPSIVSTPPASSSKTSTRHTTFLPLHVGDELPIPSLSKIEVVTKTGLTLRFPVDISADTLIAVVQRLEVVSC